MVAAAESWAGCFTTALGGPLSGSCHVSDTRNVSAMAPAPMAVALMPVRWAVADAAPVDRSAVSSSAASLTPLRVTITADPFVRRSRVI